MRWKIVAPLALWTACAVDVEEEAPVEEPLFSEDAMVIDFGIAGTDDWIAVNDTVMGGVSSGTVTYDESVMVFEGVVSTDSNGGFTSVRGPQTSLDLSGYDRVLIHLRSTGQPFSMVLAHKVFWFEDQFKFDIPATGDDWKTIEIPLADFENYAFNGGYPTATGTMMTPEDRSEILHIEFMSKLFEDGDFRLEVDFIAFD